MLLPLQEVRAEEGGWAYNATWAYTTVADIQDKFLFRLCSTV